MARTGGRSFSFRSFPRIVSSASFVGEKEGKGPIGSCFDVVFKDDTLATESWEKAESRMFESAVRTALFKLDAGSEDLDLLIGGDLLNQIVSAGFAAREIHSPFIGLYSACSTISESLLVGAMLTDGGYSDLTACAASSHYSSVERQFRYPLEMGVQPVPTSQRTVTGAGCMVLCPEERKKRLNSVKYGHVAITGGTLGVVEDYGISDANNMGAAMAPAALSTIKSNLSDLGRSAADYDLIITGDLGRYGSELLEITARDAGIDLSGRHEDCGRLVFGKDQKTVCGGSGCGCAASVFSSYYLPRIESGELKRVLFLATGALLSPVTTLQGESIPGIAHAVVIEHID